MSELGEAYVQIMPSTRGLGNKIKDSLNSEAGDAGRSAGNNIASTIKRIIAAAGLGKVIKDALSAGGNLEQSFGGLDTIYGDAAAQAKEFAAQAASAGISANSYAEQAVSFGASLRQAYGGDMTKAMNAANTAIMDMADNSAKMGTDIGSIQAAYQGFAKQNYTMLDNLKLGYGGTKTEMERLLKEATKLSGIEYNIDNLGDVYDAIHVIQEDLKLTGVAADEAKNTLTGSANAMKASWENLMAFMTSGEGDLGPAISNLGENVGNFAKNVVRMLGNLVKNIPTLLSGISSTFAPMASEMLMWLVNGITTGLPKLAEGFKSVLMKAWEFAGNLPELIESGSAIIGSILNGIVRAATRMTSSAAIIVPKIMSGITKAIPTLFSAGFEIVGNLVDGLVSALPEMLSHATEIIPTVTEGIMSAISGLQAGGVEILNTIISGITTALPNLLSTGLEIVTQLVESISTVLPELLVLGTGVMETLINGISEALPELISIASDFIPQIITTITGLLPMILENGAEILNVLISGIIANIPTLVAALPQLINGIVNGITANLPMIVSTGLTLIRTLVQGVISAIPTLIAAMPQLISAIVSGLSTAGSALLSAGADLVKGIWQGISNSLAWIKGKITEWVGNVTSFIKSLFGISSPSKVMRDEVGIFLAKGVGVGFERGMSDVNQMIRDAVQTDYRMSATVGMINAENRNLQAAQMSAVSGSSGQVFNLYIDGIKYNTDEYIEDSITGFIETMVRKQKMYAGA